MRNLKKVIALVAVFAMLVSTVAFAGSYTDVADTDNYAEAIEMLSSLNILTGDKDANGNAVFRPNDSITRAEVATIVERIQAINNVAPTATQFTDVPAEHWASGYIAQAAGQGIINGYGDGTFGPEDNVLYEQAVKMLVETLGYAPFVEANGGYYAGHLLAASRYGILDGVKGAAPGQEATRGQVAQLVYNAIDTPIMERSAFGTEEKFEIFDGGKDGEDEFITLLTRDLGVVKGTGIVSANAVTGSIDTSEEEEIDFIIDDTTKEYACYDLEDLDDGTVYANGTNAGAYLGLEVNFYAEEIKNGEYNLISVAPTSRNKTMAISLSDVIDFDGEELKYYEDDNVEDVSLASDADFITLSYNGVTVDNYTDAEELADDFAALINPLYSGQVTLVDNGSARGYSIIALEVAVSAVVDEVRGETVTFKENVRTTDGKGFIKLDFDPDETSTLIKLTKNGAPFDYAQLTEWDVLSILANSDKDYYIAEVIDGGKITGAVEERSASDISDGGWEYKINGQYYDVAANAYGTGSLKPSSEGTFYIDAYGKIVAFDKTSTTAGVTSDKYAYIMNASVTTDEWGNNNIRVQWLDKTGEIGDTYLASKVVLTNVSDDLADALEGAGVTFETETTDGEDVVSYTEATITMESFATPDDTRIDDLRDALVNQFVTYSLSANNLKSIVFAMAEGDDEDVDLINLGAAGAATYDEEDKELTIGTDKYELADETLVFYMDAEGEDSIAEDGAIASKYLSKVATVATLATGSYDYVEAYDFDDEVPTVLVIYDESALVSPNTNIAVIEAVGEATIDGEKVTSITYWMNGAKATAYSDPTADVADDNDIETAAKGDIWKLIVDGTTVASARKLASYERDIDEADEAGAAIFDIVASSEDMVWGPVTANKNGVIRYAAANDFDAIEKVKYADANVYVVEYVRGKLVVSAGTAADAEFDEQLVDAAIDGGVNILDKATDAVIVADGEAALGMMDYIFAVSYDDEVQDIVVYKAGDFDKWVIEEVEAE